MRAPPMPETLMAGPWEGTDGDPGVPTTYVGGIDGEPLEALTEIWEHPPLMSETLMVGPPRRC
jgi:hypothetical protein